jgi:4-hydroxy-tetrahydrodipicolinate synthase
MRPVGEMRARRANALNVSVVKEALAQLGLCRAAVRPPISELTPISTTRCPSIAMPASEVACCLERSCTT